MTTIVLADDHALVRDGLKTVLGNEPDFSIVGEAADGVQAVLLVERLHPDVLIVDLMLPSLSGLDVIRQVAKRVPQTCMIALSMHATAAFVVEALRGGAAAYVLKDSSSTDIIHAIREATAGRRFLSHPLSQDMLNTYAEKSVGEPLDPYETLTRREREVFQLAAEGKTSAQIAEQLHLSSRTVETHRANMMRKLGISGQIELVRFAMMHGLLPIHP